MPGVLTEIGFLSNPKEAVYLKSEAGQDEIARSLFVSVKNYSDYVLETRRRAEEEAAQAPPKPAPKPEPAPAPSDDAAAKPEKKTGAHFAIQILSSKKTVASDSPEFKNYRGKVREYTADGEFRYKYCVCECDTKAEAQQRIEEVRRTFPGAFIVRCKGDKIAK
ncbi:MAG TPA: N-acetylmuramoyl-L-alanine amidase, partial [Alistipes sp.]|nr:N-acetylmuramoyl-L-alanine amidase [Alistipes sp.]